MTLAPTVTPLTTLAAVKADLGVTDAAQDAALERLISRASAAIATFCGREFGVQTVTETFARCSGVDYQQVRPLVLSGIPVAALSSMTVAAGPLAQDAYAVEPSAGLLHRLSAGALRAWGADLPVTVVYSAGYPDIPVDVEAAALALIGAAWATAQSTRDPAVRVETVEGVGRTEYFERTTVAPMQLDSTLRAQLAPYKARF